MHPSGCIFRTTYMTNVLMYNPPPDLVSRSLSRISLLQKNILLRRRIIIGTLCTLGLVPGLATFGYRSYEAAGHSGFLSYMSLLFTDTRMVVSNFREFLFSLLETLPILDPLIFMLGLLIVMIALHYLATYVIELRRNLLKPLSLIHQQ